MPRRYIEGSDNMDITTLSQLVGSLGFPILASCALFYQIQLQNKEHKSEIKDLTECMSNIQDAINGNTMVLQRVLDKLDMESEVKK